MTAIKILGLDPGTATTGWGLVNEEKKQCKLEAFGCINTNKNQPEPNRLLEIAVDLESLLKKYRPDEVAIEDLFFYKNLKTAIKVAQSRGVLIVICRKCKIPVFEYTPLQIKQAITGYGRAEKSQVQVMVKNLLSLEQVPKPDDAADALAVAICHQQSRRINML